MAEVTNPEDVPPGAIPLVTSAANAQTVFADAVWFAANLGDVVRIQLVENILEPTNSPSPGLKARHVGTLVMPRIGFRGMVTYLNSMAEYFDKLDTDSQTMAATNGGI